MVARMEAGHFRIKQAGGSLSEMFYLQKESKKQGREGGREGDNLQKKTTRKFSVVVGSFGGGGSGGGITIDDVSHLETTASLGSGQLQTCLDNRPGYLTNHWERERVILE